MEEHHSTLSAPGLMAASPSSVTATNLNGNKNDDTITNLGGRFLAVPGGCKPQKTHTLSNGKKNRILVKFPTAKMTVCLNEENQVLLILFNL